MDSLEDIRACLGVSAIIGFSGGADGGDKEVSLFVAESVRLLAQYKVAILSGGTDEGVPLYAIEAAKRHRLPTIGVYPERAALHALSGLDRAIVVPPRIGESAYGDESEVFVKACDGIEMIAGGNGTAIEFYHAMKINQGRIRHGQRPIYVAPVAGMGGFSQRVYNTHVPGYIDSAMPAQPVGTPDAAIQFLIEHLRCTL